MRKAFLDTLVNGMANASHYNHGHGLVGGVWHECALAAGLDAADIVEIIGMAAKCTKDPIALWVLDGMMVEIDAQGE